MTYLQRVLQMRNAFEYFRYLILHKDVDQALMVWQQTASRFGLLSYLSSSSNLIARVSDGCATLHFSAALVKFNSSATARK